MSAAGILLACRTENGWEVCLACRAIWPGRGKWMGAGGRIRRREAPLATAYRETAEEWCGGRDPLAFFAEYVPLLRRQPHEDYHGDWSFFTFLVEVQKKFPEAHIRLNSEFYSPPRWFAARSLPKHHEQGLLKGNVLRAARRFELL